jgi:hypothetical protein
MTCCAAQCDETCTNSAHKTPFQQDKVFAKDIYRIAPNDVKAIQWEIMTNGPVTFNYHVFDDFPLYKVCIVRAMWSVCTFLKPGHFIFFFAFFHTPFRDYGELPENS